MNVLVLNTGDSGCDYYRIILPLTELAKHGHEVRWPRQRNTYQRVSPGSAAQTAELPTDEDLTWADLAVGRQLNYPGLAPHWDRWAAFCPLVYETDDDVFQVDTTNPALSTFLHPGVEDALRHMLGSAELVTTPTDRLSQQMSQYAPAVATLPNYIDRSALVHKQSLDDLHPDRQVTVGWAGSTSHVSDWMAHAGPITRWRKAHSEVDFHLVGIDYRPMLEVEARFTPWAPTRDYYRNLDFDIGLAPLKRTRFNESKSPVKALEYAARGIPMVASAGTAYDDFVIHGVTGYLVEEPAEWAQFLDELVNDPERRARMGLAARELASSWTIDRHWQEWEAAYESVV